MSTDVLSLGPLTCSPLLICGSWANLAWLVGPVASIGKRNVQNVKPTCGLAHGHMVVGHKLRQSTGVVQMRWSVLLSESASGEVGQPGFEFADAPVKLGEAVEGSHGFQPLPIFHCRISGVERAGRHIAGHTALGGDDGAVAYAEVASRTYLSGEDAVVPNPGRAGQARLAAQHGVSADLGSVANQDEVIELGTAADAGFADCGAIHASIGLYFDVVFEHGRAGLLHFVPGSVLLPGEAEAVTADYGAILQDDAMTDAAKFADHGMGMGEEVLTDASAAIDGNEAVQDGIAADSDVLVDEAVRTNVRAFADVGRLGNDRSGMDAGGVARGLVKEFDGVGEGEIWIRRAQGSNGRRSGRAYEGDTVFDEDGRGARRFEKREVAAIGEEGELAGFGVVDSRDATNFDVRTTFEAAVQLLRKFREFHR